MHLLKHFLAIVSLVSFDCAKAILAIWVILFIKYVRLVMHHVQKTAGRARIEVT